MVKNSVIIPNRGYDRWLRHCLWSLERSHSLSGLRLADVEVVVVSDSMPSIPGWLGLPVNHLVAKHGRYFNKPLALNVGIEHSSGDVLTFLDADSIVGPRFLETGLWLLQPEYAPVTKLCYRVRQLPGVALQLLDSAVDPVEKEHVIAHWFCKANSYPPAFEGYGSAEPWDKRKGPRPDKPVFGNSQFSIRRDVLGDLRFDEEYAGRGFEDCEMNRRIARHYGDKYNAVMVTDPDHTMFHIANPNQGEVWGPGEQNSLNAKRYFST